MARQAGLAAIIIINCIAGAPPPCAMPIRVDGRTTGCSPGYFSSLMFIDVAAQPLICAQSRET